MQPTNGATGTASWPGIRATATTPLRTFVAIGDNALNANAALDSLATLTFDGRGLLVGGGAGTVDLCDPTDDRGRRVDISLIGRVSSQELVCP